MLSMFQMKKPTRNIPMPLLYMSHVSGKAHQATRTPQAVTKADDGGEHEPEMASLYMVRINVSTSAGVARCLSCGLKYFSMT
jgi:hypothetical protein